MVYQSYRIIKMKGGSGTIRSYQKRGRASAGDNIELGEHFVKYIYKGRPVVIKPKNILVFAQMFICNYVSGGGVSFIGSGYSPKKQRYDGDLLVTILGRDEIVPDVLNISGSSQDLNDLYSLSENSSASQYSSAPFVVIKNRLAIGESQHSPTTDVTWLQDCRTTNQIVFKGVMQTQDENGKWSITEAGNGHWGLQATYDGVEDARIGNTTYRSQALSV